MKRTIAFLISICMALTLICAPVYGVDETPIRVVVNGEELVFDVAPVIENDRTLVPLRAIFEALGADVNWDEASRTANAVKGKVEITITIDSADMMKNGKAVLLDAPARLIGGRTLVPVRAVSEGLGAKVDWNEAGRTVQIKMPEGKPARPNNPEETDQPTEPEKQDSKNDMYSSVPQGKTTISYETLSDADMLRLKERIPQLRSEFERTVLPTAIQKDSAALVSAVTSLNTSPEEFVRNIWNDFLIENIIEIQLTSDMEYVYEGNPNADEIQAAFIKLIQKADIGFESNYLCITKSKYRNSTARYSSPFGGGYLLTTEETKIVLLEALHNTQENDIKFIGIIPDGFYYTAEIMGGDNRKLKTYKVIQDDRLFMEEIDNSIDYFFEAINEYL